MDFWKDLLAILQSATISVSIIVGGIWTYFIFIRQRLKFPKVDIDFSFNDITVPEGSRLIHAETKITNVGSVVLRSDYAELRLRQIVPIPRELKKDVEGGFDPVRDGRTEVDWPMIAGREWKWGKGDFEIEPGESDSLHSDFLISGDILAIEFYGFISNAKKKQQGIGWTFTKIYELNLVED